MENLSPHFVKFCLPAVFILNGHQVVTEAVLLWPDGCFLSLMRIAPRHLSVLPWLLRLQLAADDRAEI